jgi:nucleoside diphosphate kinase
MKLHFYCSLISHSTLAGFNLTTLKLQSPQAETIPTDHAARQGCLLPPSTIKITFHPIFTTRIPFFRVSSIRKNISTVLRDASNYNLVGRILRRCEMATFKMQGCQMVCFQTKIPMWVNFSRTLDC